MSYSAKIHFPSFGAARSEDATKDRPFAAVVYSGLPRSGERFVLSRALRDHVTGATSRDTPTGVHSSGVCVELSVTFDDDSKLFVFSTGTASWFTKDGDGKSSPRGYHQITESNLRAKASELLRR